MDFPSFDIFHDESQTEEVEVERLPVKQRETYRVKSCPPQRDPSALGKHRGDHPGPLLSVVFQSPPPTASVSSLLEILPTVRRTSVRQFSSMKNFSGDLLFLVNISSLNFKPFNFAFAYFMRNVLGKFTQFALKIGI